MFIGLNYLDEPPGVSPIGRRMSQTDLIRYLAMTIVTVTVYCPTLSEWDLNNFELWHLGSIIIGLGTLNLIKFFPLP